MDAVVKARVNSGDKDVAAAVLNELGLNLSDLIRMAIMQTARTKRLPVSLALSAESRSAIDEIEQGKALRASKEACLDLPSASPRTGGLKKGAK